MATVTPGNTNIIDLTFNRGIDGSSAISAIQDGFCVNSENVDLSTVGKVSKRAGYNVYNHKLPVKYNLEQTANPTRRFLDFTPLFSVYFRAYPNTKEVQTSLGLTATEDDLYNTLICKFTSELPSGFTLDDSHMFKILQLSGVSADNHDQIKPILLGNNLFLIPRNTVYTSSLINMTTIETKGYLDYFVSLVTGYSLARITSDTIVEINQTSTTTVDIEFTDTPELSLNDVIFFETGPHLDPATEYTGANQNNPSGTVTSITGNVATITLTVATFRGDYLEENSIQYKTPNFVRVPTSYADLLTTSGITLRAGYSMTATDYEIIKNQVVIATGNAFTTGNTVITFTEVAPLVEAKFVITTGILTLQYTTTYFTTDDEVIFKYKTVTGDVAFAPVTIGTIPNRNVSFRYAPASGLFVTYDIYNNMFKYGTLHIYGIANIRPLTTFDTNIVKYSPFYVTVPYTAGANITATVEISVDRYQDITKLFLIYYAGVADTTGALIAVGSTSAGDTITFRIAVAGDQVHWSGIADYAGPYGLLTAGTLDFTSCTLNVTTGALVLKLANNLVFADEAHFSIAYYESNFNPTIAPANISTTQNTLPGYIYGLNANIGLVETVGVLNDNEVIAGYNGNLFSDYPLTTNIPLTTNPGLYCQTVQNLTAVLNAGVYEFTIPAKYKNVGSGSPMELVHSQDYYIIGDYIKVGNYNLLVLAVTDTNVVVDAGGLTNLNIPAYSQISYIRTSNKVYIKDFSSTNMQPLSHSSTIQIGNYGREAAWYVVNRVQSNYIELTESITYASDSSIEIGNVFLPLWHGNPVVGDYKPISQDKYIGENINIISSVSFNKSLYFAYGNNGIWRYDGISLENMKLPAPVNCFMRSVPGSFGFLPTYLSGTKRSVFPITVYITYSYIDGYGQEIETPITSSMGMTITANAVNDGSLSSEVIEIQIPSVQTGSTFKTDVVINIYRNGWLGLDTVGDINYRIDEPVANNPNAPYTRAFIGRIPGSTSTSQSVIEAEINARKQLYTTVSVTASENDFFPTNINPPNASKLITFNNRLIAFNGNEDPFYSFRCLKVFSDVDDVSTDKYLNKFDAYMSLRYYPTGLKSYTYGSVTKSFHTITLGVNAATTAVVVGGYAPVSNLDGGINVAPRWAGLYKVNNPITDVTYTDLSNRFTLTGVDHNLVISTGSKVVLRSLSALPILPIDLNGEEFEALQPAGALATTLFSNLNRWTSPETGTNFLPSSLVTKDRFAMYILKTTAPSIETTATEYVQVSATRDPITDKLTGANIRVFVTAGGDLDVALTAIVGAAAAERFVVIRGLGFGGNIELDNNASALSWDRDLIFGVTYVSAVAPVAEYFLLTPKKLITSTVAVTYVPTVITNATSFRSSTNFSVYGAATNSGGDVSYLVASAFNNPSKVATIVLTNAVAINTSLEIGGTTNPLPKYFPRLEGTFTTLLASATTQDITVVPPTKLTSVADSTVTHLGTLTIPSSKISDSVYLDANGYLCFRFVYTAEYIYMPTYAYILIRGDLYNSISLQLSGWHKLDKINITKDGGNNYITVPTFTKPGVIDYAAINTYTSLSFPLAGILFTLEEAAPTNLDIPVPMPNMIADTANNTTTDSINHGSLHDLAMPMFSISSTDNLSTSGLVGKRFAGAINSVMGNVGFAYWGSEFGDYPGYYPDGGFKFIPHRSSVDKYKHVFDTSNALFGNVPNTFISTPGNVSVADYNKPDDKWLMRVKNVTDYSMYASIKVSNNAYVPQEFTNLATAPNNTTFVVIDPSYPNRMWTTGEERNTNRLARQTAFKQISPIDIGAGDGQDLTGGVTFGNVMLFFKPNSIYRMGILSDNTTLSSPDKVQTTVGTVAGNNIIANEDSCFFIHYTGVYKTDGVNLSPVLVLNRPFNDRVVSYSDYFRYTTGYNDAINKEIHLGIPLDSSDTSSQFMYTYNDNVLGWSINTHIPATKWVRVGNKDVFGSTDDGYIYQIRTETGNTKYSDLQAGIPFKVQTRYLDSGEIMTWKFYKNAMFMFGSRYPSNPTISYAWDYAEAFEPLQVFPIKDQRYGVSEFGKSCFGTTKHIEFRRRLLPTRVANMSFLIEESTPATPFELFKINVEGFLLNTKYMKQAR